MQSTFRKIRPSRAPSNDNSSSPSNVQQPQARQIKIDARHNIRSIAFLDGKHVVSASDKPKIRFWRAEDGKEAVGTSMDAGSTVSSIAVSRDGKLVVSGMIGGEVMVWNAESHKKVIEFRAHSKQVFAVDVSPDATQIVTGSEDKTACIWSLSTEHQLLGPLKHDNTVVATKFSPNGCFIATATWDRYSIRIYDNQNVLGVVEGLIRVNSAFNQSLAWASDSKQLFALSSDGIINCLDVSTGNAVFQWHIHSSNYPTCIALASNSMFIAASGGSSVSFWDTTTHEQIGKVVQDDRLVQSMTISSNGLATGGNKTITLHSLCDILPSSHCGDVSASNQQLREQGTEQMSKTVDCEDWDKRIADPGGATQKPRLELKIPQRAANRELNSLNETIRSLCRQNKKLNDENEQLKETLQNLQTDFTDCQHKVHALGQLLHAHEWKHQCEVLYKEGHIIDAAKSFLGTANTTSEGVRTNKLFVDWLPEFTRRCISMLERNGDKESSANHDDALAAYSTALLLSPSIPNTLLTKWARTALSRNPANKVLSAAAEFNLPRFLVYRVICDALERGGRISEAIECFQRLQRSDAIDPSHTAMNVPEKEMTSMDETEWVANFKVRCLRKLEQRGDLAMSSASYEDAIIDYTTALTLDPMSTDLLTKRSKARAKIGSWEDSLEDADAAIKLNPSSPHGYKRKHAALVGARHYDEAINAYNDMLQKIEQSPDLDTRKSRERYVSPSETMAMIRDCVKQVQQNTPLVLINTETGRLCDKYQCLGEFEADPKFKELVSSTTTRLDDSRIIHTVQEYFRYATFSHTWEDATSLFHDVLHESVHALADSPTVLKLAMFCMTVQKAGLRWAWCDTCCINAADGSVVQESLTSMFRWYHGSFLTIVHLKGVRSDSELITLERSFWNTRAWTLQEFFASKVIRFYTEDWKPYLPHEDVYNHKDSSAIMREMAAANGVDEQVLLSLRPGPENVRQKLCLAATRTATKEEDKAYSLFGIFDVSIAASYGEKQQRALGRLLQEVLTRSGDVTLLAWTGKASDYNSCLPADISVYRTSASPHVPRPIEDDKMDTLVAELRTSTQYTDSVKLYDQVVALSSPRLVSHRLSLSCFMFPLKGPLVQSTDCPHIYRAVTSALGNVDIKTTEDLPGLNSLVLVHPWLQCLLDPAHPIQDLNADDPSDRLSSLDGDDRDDEPDTQFTDTLSPPSSHIVSPSQNSSQPDKLTKALRLFARLREPFGALLLVPTSHKEYKRVASDNPIVVQLHKDVAPRYLLQKIRTLDIL